MLTRPEALKAKRTLSDWLAKRNDRMTEEEEETIELLLTSPVGDRACTKLGTTLHHVRDLIRLGYGRMPEHIEKGSITYHLDRLKAQREAAGLGTSVPYFMSAAALLSGPAGRRISSDLDRLDAVLTILWHLKPARASEDAE